MWKFETSIFTSWFYYSNFS